MPADKQEALATVGKYLFDLPEFKGEQTTDNWEPTGTDEYEVEDVELQLIMPFQANGGSFDQSPHFHASADDNVGSRYCAESNYDRAVTIW
jgi:hypothetical protein